MKRATGKRPGPQRLAFLAVSLAALAGCEEGFDLKGPEERDAAAEKAENSQSQTIELFPETATGRQRDVEAPELFQVTEAGLWDGRPSLGGTWVAHPDVQQPQRVLIKNTANDKSITGALFRRDRNLPGPALQVSSSAAAELGMLAGAPTRIEVVALKRETVVPDPAPAEPEGEVETASAETPDTNSPETPAKRKWWQKKPAADTGADVAAAAVATGAAVGVAAASSADDPAEAATPVADQPDVAAADTADAVEEPPKRKWWQRKPAEETNAAAVDAAVAGTAVGAVAATVTTEDLSVPEPQTTGLTDPVVTAPTDEPKKRKWWQRKKTDEITTTTLDPIAGAAAAIDTAESTPAAPLTATTVAATASTAPQSALSKPYVQIGTFGVEENANSAAQKVRRNGMSAEVSELKTEDKTVWRVLVGPVATRSDRRALLSDVKDLGFTDAFIARN